MKVLRNVVAFWIDFIVGDDWRMAAGVGLSLVLCAGLAHAGLPSWWLVPVGVIAALGVSLRRASTAARARAQAARPTDGAAILPSTP